MERDTKHTHSSSKQKELQENKHRITDVPESHFSYDANLLGVSDNDIPVQKKPAAREEEELQMKAENNTGLPDNLKAGVENLSGHSMDDVTVHYNSNKPAQLQAHAYAQGADIHLASGQEQHLPHEAWHVAQQKQGRVTPTVQAKGININDDQGLEKEADIMGAKAQQHIPQDNIQSAETNTSPVQRNAEDLPVQRLKWSEVHTGNTEEIGIGKSQMPEGVEEQEDTVDRQVFAGQTSKGRHGFLWLKEATREIQYDIKSMKQYKILDDTVVFYTAVRETAVDPINEHGIDPNYGNVEKPDGSTEYNVRGFNYFAKDTKIPRIYGEKFLAPDPFVILEFTLPIGTMIERDPEIPNGLRTTYHIQPGDLQ